MNARRLPLQLFTILALLARALGAQETTQSGGEPTPIVHADLIVRNARITTQDDARAEVAALAVRDGSIVATGGDEEIAPWRGPKTRVIDALGRRVIPGLVDSHLHVVRGGLYYGLELRWEGVRSLAEALRRLREQAQRTPPGQWVRVVGGWSPHQFAERRMPTVEEIDAAAGATPALVLYLYSQALLNRAGVATLGLDASTKVPAGGRIERFARGAILHAEPSPAILYQTVAQLPKLSAEERELSTRHFYRELNRLGLTSAVDAGGGGHAYPTDYAATRSLAQSEVLPLRISGYLFAQTRGAELADFERWTAAERLDVHRAVARLASFGLEGAGENLVWSAGDFENFLAPRPELDARMEAELGAVVRVLARRAWPLRIHATYDESITRILDVLEPIFRETEYTSRWALDHAETISLENLRRVKRLGGGIAIQDRLAFAGEEFCARYGDAARDAPPLRHMLELGIPVGAGTDATRVSSYDPWVAIAWMVRGRTVGGMELLRAEHRLSRAEALRLYTLGSAWFSGEERDKGRLAPGQLADFAVLSEDLFSVPEERIAEIESVLTVTGGEIVYAAAPFAELGPPPLPAWSSGWLPAAHFGGIPSKTSSAR
ncbi:MAG: amidohydrolase [Planctomycetes bacterium]|nr:amidohydrolase [Planctomycetota bacterium]